MPRGEWNRTNVKLRAEQVHQLDIRQLNVDHGYRGAIGVGGFQVHYRVDDDLFVIESHGQIVKLDETPCHYGGHRRWFRCPGCDKRVAILYDRRHRYFCRTCHDLPYTSQRVKEQDRLRIKVRKIRELLNASYDLSKPVMVKPKGMHWRTFESLVIREKIAHDDFVMALTQSLRLPGAVDR